MNEPLPVDCEFIAQRAVSCVAAAWNSRCPEQRHRWLQQAWQPDALYADAGVVLRGVPALARHIGNLRDRLGEARFTADPLHVDGAELHFRWHLRDRGGASLLSGRCDARLGADGRFTTLVSAVQSALPA